MCLRAYASCHADMEYKSETRAPQYLTSAFDRGDLSATRSGVVKPGIHCTEGCPSFRALLDSKGETPFHLIFS